MLLDPATKLTELTVEGVRDAAETDDKANWDGVDCALYFDDTEVPNNSRIELVQLKYSVTGPSKKWTLARFCSSTKKTGNNSVARRLAGAFKSATKVKKSFQDEASLSIKLVSNQPIAKNLRITIEKASRGELEGIEYDKLKRATGLGKNQLIQFCKLLALEGGENARAELREQNTKAIAELILGPVKDMADNLRVRIQESLGPERSSTIKCDTVLSWFNLGRGQGLFPCESKFEPLAETIIRSVTKTLTSEVQKHPLVVLHGKGGCGKTTTVRSLETVLPPGSKTIVYDCYGAGSYRDPSTPRHNPWQGFTQLSNELARLTNTPLFFPYTEREDMAPSFRQKLETASDIFGRDNPDSLLVIVIDAADNIVAHAASQNPPQACFANQLLGFLDIPQNVRIVITCRTSKLSTMNLPEKAKLVRCSEFSLSETIEFVAIHGLVGCKSAISDFHELSRHIPRVQSSALAGAKSLSEAVVFLRPNGRSLNDLFEVKVQEALHRSGVTLRRGTWCAALDELVAPIPIVVLSRVCGLSDEVTEDIVGDLAPNLRLGDRRVEFSNEDFESYCRNAAQGEVEKVRIKIADVLVSERLVSSYAASHLFDALIICGRKSEIGEYLGEKDGTAAIADPVARRRVDLSRLRGALHIASNNQDKIAVGETIFVGAEALRSSRKVDNLILSNTDLSATFLEEETIGKMVLNDPLERDRQGSVLLHLAREKARQGKLFESEVNLQAAEEWMLQTIECDMRLHSWTTMNLDIVAQLSTFYTLHGWPHVEQGCECWTGPAYRVFLRKRVLAKIVVEYGPDIIPELLKDLDPCYHFLAINCLCRSGVTPTTEQREIALDELTKFEFDQLGKDDGYGSEPMFVAELRSEIIFFLEGLVQTELMEQHSLKLVLEKLKKGGEKDFRNLYLFYPKPVDFLLRASILTALLNGKEPDLESVFIEFSRHQEKERTQNSERDLEITNQRYDEIRALLPAYSAYADLLMNRTDAAVMKLNRETSNLGSSSSSSYRYSDARSLLRLRATDLLVSSSLDKKTKVTFLLASLVEKEGFGDQEADLCENVLHSPLMRSIVAQELDQKSEAIERLHTRATEKSESLLSIARVYMDFSKDHASTVFRDALKVAEEVDLEAIDILHSLCRIVKRERPDTPQTRKLLGAFARLVRHAGDLLQSEDGFPLEEALEAIILSNPPVGAMTASCWGDEGFSARCNEIELFLKGTLEMGWLCPPNGYALAQILGGLPPSIEDKMLNKLDEVPKDVAGELLAHLVERKTLEITPYSDAHIPTKLEELCQSGRSASEAWTQLVQTRNFKAKTLAAQKPDDEETDTSQAEVKNERGDDRADWESVDPMCVDAIAEAQKADQTAGIFDYKERLLELRNRVGFSNRKKHLDTLAQCARASSWSDDEIEAIFTALDDWSDRVTSEWCRNELPKLTVDLGHRTMGYSWHHGERFTELQARSGLPPEGRRKVVLELVEQNAEKLGAASLLKLLAEYVNTLDQEKADNLLALLIDRSETRLNIDDSRCARESFDPLNLPSSQSEITSALIYRYLGDIDARVRWQTSHAVFCAVRLGQFDVIKGILDYAIGPFNFRYTYPDCPFQEMNADQQLSLVLARVSSFQPAIIEKHEAEILKVWNKNKPHILIGHFLARALREARQRGANIKVDESDLASMNGSASVRAERSDGRYSRNFKRHTDLGSRFRFDGTDIIPYWYSPACRVFADLSESELLQVAEDWIVNRCGGHKETSHWENETRKRRVRDDEYGLYSASHGSLPTIHRHWVYLQWHGLHMAVGELLKSRQLNEDDDDNYDTLEGWLERNDTTYPTVWVSDLLGSLPLSERYWERPEPDREEWVGEVDAVDLLGDLFGEDGSLVLSQSREHRMYENGDQAAHSEIRSNAAFVPSKTAPALLRAYATIPGYHDIFIPPHTAEFAGSDEKNNDFCFFPATQRPMAGRNDGVDDEDPRRYRCRGVAAAPSKTLLDALKIPLSPLRFSSWGVDESKIADLRYRTWSTTPDASEGSMRNQSCSYIDGYRLSINKASLQKSMISIGCDLVVTVHLERSVGSDYGQSRNKNRKRIAQKRVEVIRLGRDGTYQTRSGCRGTWAQDHRRT